MHSNLVPASLYHLMAFFADHGYDSIPVRQDPSSCKPWRLVDKQRVGRGNPAKGVGVSRHDLNWRDANDGSFLWLPAYANSIPAIPVTKCMAIEAQITVGMITHT